MGSYLGEFEMNMSSVETMREFADFVDALVQRKQNKNTVSLEVYLRSLWGVILKNRNIPPSWTLFAYLVLEAFYEPPLPFEDDWMKYEEASLVHQDNIEKPFEALQELILFQIADLNRMQMAGIFELNSNILFLGVTSPTGHSWYNFFPISYLECGVAPIDQYAYIDDCSWFDLAVVLLYGQIYE